MCGGAGGGAPWRQWGDGGRHGRCVFYFSSLHLANCVSGVRPLKNQQKTNQSDRLVIYIATPLVTKYLRTIQRNWSMIEKTAFKAYSFWWFRQQSTGNKEIKLAVLFGFNRGIWPFYAACRFDELSRGSALCLLNASFEKRFHNTTTLLFTQKSMTMAFAGAIRGEYWPDPGVQWHLR